MGNFNKFKNFYNYANLSKEEELYLFKDIENNQSNRDTVINSHLKLVLKESSYYLFLEQSILDDIVQCGSLSVVQSIDNFDISFGNRFSSFIRPKISGSIKTFLRKNCSLWKISEQKIYLLFKLLDFIEEELKTNGNNPTIEEMSKYLGVENKKIIDLLNIISEEHYELCYSYYSHLYNLQSKNMGIFMDIEKILDKLPKKHKRILKLRYYDNKTWRQIGDIINKSGESARKTHNKVILALRSEYQ